MKKLLLLLMVAPLFSLCQVDTIYNVNGEVIPCKITEVKKEYLRYDPQKGPDNTIAIGNVHSYVWKGEKTILLTNAGGKKIIEDKNTVNLSDDYAYLKMCLGEAHKEYKTGVRLVLIGTLASGVGAVLMSVNSTTSGQLLTIGGGVFTFVGGISMISSHKWFGRAALGLNGNGATVTYRFK